MKQRYNEVMEHIVVTDEMRARILQNAAAQCKPSDPAQKGDPF